MDSGLRQGMRNMPTEQKPHNAQENTPLPHISPRKPHAIHSHRDGSNHRTSQEWRIRRHPHYSRSWMLTRSSLLTMHHRNHLYWNSQAIFRPPLQMVWAPHAHHQRQRPAIYLALRQGAHKESRNTAKSIHGISPSNGRSIRKEEPMG